MAASRMKIGISEVIAVASSARGDIGFATMIGTTELSAARSSLGNKGVTNVFLIFASQIDWSQLFVKIVTLNL